MTAAAPFLAVAIEAPFVEGWQLTPEGGAIHPDERIAVIADVHLGYEWARGAAGDCVPAHSLAETLKKLERLLERSPIDRLVVAGDLVESPRPCARTAADLARLARWLDERDVRLVLIEGNHDRSLAWMAREKGLDTAARGAGAPEPPARRRLDDRARPPTRAGGSPDLGSSSSRVAGFRPLGALLSGGRRADHPARVFGQCRGAGRRFGPAAGRLAAKLPALSCQHGRRAAGLRALANATCPAGMIDSWPVCVHDSAEASPLAP